MKKIKLIHKLMMLALPVLLLAGCGSGSPAPIGATISISPDKIDWVGAGKGAVGAPACAPSGADRWAYDPFTITVIGSNGRPIQSIDVDYTLSLTLETSTDGAGGAGVDLQRLYLGPATGTNPPPVRIRGAGTLQTDINGKIQLIVGTDVDCIHTASLTVHTGSSYTNAPIDVK